MYQKLSQQYQSSYIDLKRKLQLLSVIRLLCGVLIILSIYQYFGKEITAFLYIGLVAIVALFVGVKLYAKLSWKAKVLQNLVEINQQELDYVEKGELLEVNRGDQFVKKQDTYAYDLDFFGEKSLYHHLNRAYTYYGEKALHQTLLSTYAVETIQDRQKAVKELSAKLAFRQKLAAIAKTVKAGEEEHKTIEKWLNLKQIPSKLHHLIAYTSSALMTLFIVLYVWQGATNYLHYCSLLFTINLMHLGMQFKSLKSELIDSDYATRNLQRYALIFGLIEEENFKADYLTQLQLKLSSNGLKMSQEIKRLSSLIASLENIQNLFIAILFNGLFSFHTHVLYKVLKWKQKNEDYLLDGLSVLGELEALISLANLTYNNSDYCFPSLNNSQDIAFEALGHPLISSKVRVCNDVNFSEHPFIILTGSNMSGKSTFLRAVGVNMVLGSIGSVVCARSARIDPLQLLVSMRLEDSLADSTSYFFAEVKRLKSIDEALAEVPAFVLLDEILRGTNSDDKRYGTIEFIKRIIEKKAIGMIATHDLEVCELANEFPAIITNKCFEVEVVNNDLHFDYQLRTGICKSKSATFLMKKMEVI